MWSIIISTVIYFLAAWGAGWWLGREYGWERGRPRAMVAGLVGLVISSAVAWGIDAAFPADAPSLGNLAALAGGTSVPGDAAAQAKALQDAVKALGLADGAAPHP